MGPVPAGNPLRFALLTAEPAIERWLAMAIERARTDGTARCVALLLPEAPLQMPNRASSPRDVLRWPRFWGHFLLRATLLRTDLQDPVPAGEVVPGVPTLRIPVIQKGAVTRVAEAGIQEIRGLDLDFVLLGEFGILKGEVLHAARFGIWSHHHGDPSAYRGRPACFWELHDGAPTVSAGIQRINEVLDGGAFMELVTVPTQPSFRRTMESIYRESSELLTSAARAARDRAGELEHGSGIPGSKLPAPRSRPTNAAVARCVARVVRSRLAKPSVQSDGATG